MGDLRTWKTPLGFPKRGTAVRFHHFIPNIWFTGRARRTRVETEVLAFVNALYGFREIVQNLFASLIHLGPIRTPIKSVYRVTGESPATVGSTGENLLGVLYRDEKTPKRKRHNLLTHLDFWLDQKFGLVRGVQLEPLTKTRTLYALTGVDSKTATPVNLASVGFGVSQVAPIIVQGFLSQPNTCMVIEQPEIHLHPGAQADLGDLFIEFANNGKQLLIETHSPYLLYRIQRRIAESKFDASRFRVFFVSRISSGSVVEPARMDERGRILNWPPGFFEEGYTETAATAEALAV